MGGYDTHWRAEKGIECSGSKIWRKETVWKT